jgi:prophage regulatory protein
MSKQPHIDDLERLALTAADVARLLDISQRHLWALNSSGRLPRPIRLGRAVRWNAAELRDWLQAGAPERSKWEAIRPNRRP